jgi:hypothetical protein
VVVVEAASAVDVVAASAVPVQRVVVVGVDSPVVMVEPLPPVDVVETVVDLVRGGLVVPVVAPVMVVQALPAVDVVETVVDVPALGCVMRHAFAVLPVTGDVVMVGARVVGGAGVLRLGAAVAAEHGDLLRPVEETVLDGA